VTAETLLPFAKKRRRRLGNQSGDSVTDQALEKLEKKGWERKFIACEPRLSEAVDMYRKAGFEVHLEPLTEAYECETCLPPQEETGRPCRICYEGLEDQYKIIFTRPKAAATSADDDIL
jgi:hypothetical protein